MWTPSSDLEGIGGRSVKPAIVAGRGGRYRKRTVRGEGTLNATSLSRRAVLRRSASMFAVGLAAHGCTDVVQTLYPFMGNDLRMIATSVGLLVRSLQSCCETADTGA